MKHVGISTPDDTVKLLLSFRKGHSLVLWKKISKPLCHRPSFASATATSVFSVFCFIIVHMLKQKLRSAKCKARFDMILYLSRIDEKASIREASLDR